MAFYLTLLYMSMLILSPVTVMPELHPYRLQLVLASLASVVTLIGLPINGYPLRPPQTWMLVSFVIWVMLTVMLNGWLRGGLYAFMEVSPAVITFFLFVASARSVQRLRIVAVTLTALAMYTVLRGILAYHYGIGYDTYVLEQHYLFEVIERIRFVGVFADPNDLAQFLIIVMPFVGMLWRKNRLVGNVVITLPMILFLFYGVYLTHSRGGLVGLVVIMMVHLRSRFNNVVMAAGSAVLAVGLLASGMAGGRSVSISAGSDRIGAWGEGLGMLKSHPLWGVGYQGFTEHFEITAHNSYVLCFAELGLIGFFIWISMIVVTVLQLNQVIKNFRYDPRFSDMMRWALAIRLSLAGFLSTAWFLSRTYEVLLWVLMAMAVSVTDIIKVRAAALDAQAAGAGAPVDTRGGRAPAGTLRQPQLQLPQVRWLPASLAVQMMCVIGVYIFIRLRWA